MADWQLNSDLSLNRATLGRQCALGQIYDLSTDSFLDMFRSSSNTETKREQFGISHIWHCPTDKFEQFVGDFFALDNQQYLSLLLLLHEKCPFFKIVRRVNALRRKVAAVYVHRRLDAKLSVASFVEANVMEDIANFHPKHYYVDGITYGKTVVHIFRSRKIDGETEANLDAFLSRLKDIETNQEPIGNLVHNPHFASLLGNATLETYFNDEYHVCAGKDIMPYLEETATKMTSSDDSQPLEVTLSRIGAFRPFPSMDAALIHAVLEYRDALRHTRRKLDRKFDRPSNILDTLTSRIKTVVNHVEERRRSLLTTIRHDVLENRVKGYVFKLADALELCGNETRHLRQCRTAICSANDAFSKKVECLTDAGTIATLTTCATFNQAEILRQTETYLLIYHSSDVFAKERWEANMRLLRTLTSPGVRNYVIECCGTCPKWRSLLHQHGSLSIHHLVGGKTVRIYSSLFRRCLPFFNRETGDVTTSTGSDIRESLTIVKRQDVREIFVTLVVSRPSCPSDSTEGTEKEMKMKAQFECGQTRSLFNPHDEDYTQDRRIFKTPRENLDPVSSHSNYFQGQSSQESIGVIERAESKLAAVKRKLKFFEADLVRLNLTEDQEQIDSSNYTRHSTIEQSDGASNSFAKSCIEYQNRLTHSVQQPLEDLSLSEGSFVLSLAKSDTPLVIAEGLTFEAEFQMKCPCSHSIRSSNKNRIVKPWRCFHCKETLLYGNGLLNCRNCGMEGANRFTFHCGQIWHGRDFLRNDVVKMTLSSPEIDQIRQIEPPLIGNATLTQALSLATILEESLVDILKIASGYMAILEMGLQEVGKWDDQTSTELMACFSIPRLEMTVCTTPPDTVVCESPFCVVKNQDGFFHPSTCPQNQSAIYQPMSEQCPSCGHGWLSHKRANYVIATRYRGVTVEVDEKAPRDERTELVRSELNWRLVEISSYVDFVVEMLAKMSLFSKAADNVGGGQIEDGLERVLTLLRIAGDAIGNQDKGLDDTIERLVTIKQDYLTKLRKIQDGSVVALEDMSTLIEWICDLEPFGDVVQKIASLSQAPH